MKFDDNVGKEEGTCSYQQGFDAFVARGNFQSIVAKNVLMLMHIQSVVEVTDMLHALPATMSMIELTLHTARLRWTAKVMGTCSRQCKY